MPTYETWDTNEHKKLTNLKMWHAECYRWKRKEQLAQASGESRNRNRIASSKLAGPCLCQRLGTKANQNMQGTHTQKHPQRRLSQSWLGSCRPTCEPIVVAVVRIITTKTTTTTTATTTPIITTTTTTTCFQT